MVFFILLIVIILYFAIAKSLDWWPFNGVIPNLELSNLIGLVAVIGTWAMVAIMYYTNLKMIQTNQRLVEIARDQAKAAKKQAEVLWQQSQQMGRQREKPLILEEIQYIISPFIIKIDNEISRYENGIKKDIIKKGRKLLPKGQIEKEVLSRMRKKHSEIVDKIDKHNQYVSRIDEQYDELKKIIPPFIKDRYDKFLKEVGGPGITKDKTTEEIVIKNKKILERSLVYYIIEKGELVVGGVGGWVYDIWDKHKEELLEIREKGKIKRKINIIKKTWDELFSLCKELRQELWNLRNKYSENIPIPTKDFEKKGN